MRNLLMKVSYDGTDYNGFQTQPGGHTIQDYLEEAIRRLSGEQLKITASGRTDAGVHARAQVFNFYTASPIPVERWCMALNTWYAGRYRGFRCDGGTDGIPLPPRAETQNLSFYHQCKPISGSIQSEVPDPSSWKTGYRGHGAGTFSSDWNA